MKNFFLLALAGVIAQLVDGSLGMAYGVSSTTILVAAGIAPALASASVHIAEMGTTAVSGISHSSFGNVDWSKIVWLAVPGGIGALLGALLLVYVSTLEATAGYVEPVVAIFLFILGIYVLSRFAFRRTERPIEVKPVPPAFLSPLGFVAGFLDAFGGGGWGPIATPTLLSSGPSGSRPASPPWATSFSSRSGSPRSSSRSAPGARTRRRAQRGERSREL